MSDRGRRRSGSCALPYGACAAEGAIRCGCAAGSYRPRYLAAANNNDRIVERRAERAIVLARQGEEREHAEVRIPRPAVGREPRSISRAESIAAVSIAISIAKSGAVSGRD